MDEFELTTTVRFRTVTYGPGDEAALLADRGPEVVRDLAERGAALITGTLPEDETGESGDGETEDTDANPLAGVDLASDDAFELAVSVGLNADDFAGMEPAGPEGMSVDQVRKMITSRAEPPEGEVDWQDHGWDLATDPHSYLTRYPEGPNAGDARAAIASHEASTA